MHCSFCYPCRKAQPFFLQLEYWTIVAILKATVSVPILVTAVLNPYLSKISIIIKFSCGKPQTAYRPRRNQSWGGGGTPVLAGGGGTPVLAGCTPVLSWLGVPQSWFTSWPGLGYPPLGLGYPWPGLGYPPEMTWDQRLGYPPAKDLGPETWKRTWDCGTPSPVWTDRLTLWKHNLPSYYVHIQCNIYHNRHKYRWTY